MLGEEFIKCDDSTGTTSRSASKDQEGNGNSVKEYTFDSNDNSKKEQGFKGKLYPNPSDGVIHIEYSMVSEKENDKGFLFIRDVQGKLIHKVEIAAGKHVINIDLNKNKNGFYFYHVVFSDEIVQKGKFSISK
ncbi:MAG: T9SS type A sorting domain-containing protein [Flavobacteriales bacterium]